MGPMNELDWLACDDPNRLLRHLGKKYSRRKLRLFSCACCRLIWDTLGGAGGDAVAVAERFADGEATELELDEAGEAASSDGRRGDSGSVNPAVGPTWHDAFRGAQNTSAWAAGWAIGHCATMEEWDALFAAERARHCRLLRDIVGNPFRSVGVDPGVLAWEGGTVVRMARAIYDGRRFEDLPVLADALEEAGCGAEVVWQCRVLGPQFRGCWVIDLLTGRT
jgi:hypothetical protein